MNPAYSELAERIRGETDDLERVVYRAINAWESAKKSSSGQDFY